MTIAMFCINGEKGKRKEQYKKATVACFLSEVEGSLEALM